MTSTKLQIAAAEMREAEEEFRHAEGCLIASGHAPDRRIAFIAARARRNVARAAWEAENDRAVSRSARKWAAA